MIRDERPRTYVARRISIKEGKTKKDLIRCLKRYIVREVYRVLASLSSKHPRFRYLTNIKTSLDVGASS
jgi:hypothetical protein